MKKRSYAIIGTGAIGGFYGGLLQKAGYEVHFLLRRDYDEVHQRGLIIQSIWGDFTLPNVNAYDSVAEMPRCDVILIALKTTQNSLLTQLLPPLLKPESLVLVLQNGIDIEPKIAYMIDQQTLLSGLCFICSNKVGAGQIHHLDYGSIRLAEYTQNYRKTGITPAMQWITEDLKIAGIPVELSEDLFLSRWKKLVWNIPYNGLSVVLDARTDEMMNHPQTRLLIEKIMQEVVQGAAACDCMIDDHFVEYMLEHTEQMQPYLTSMKLDYDAQRPLELEAIFANPLKLAETAGITLPRIEMLYQQLVFLDQKNRQ